MHCSFPSLIFAVDSGIKILIVIYGMSSLVDSSTQALYLQADGMIRSCSTSTGAGARHLDVVNISVKDLAVVCGVSLLPCVSNQVPDEKSQRSTVVVAPIQSEVPPCLPLPPTFALPPIHWIPHPSFYDANQKVPLLVPLQEPEVRSSAVEEPVHADVDGNYQGTCHSSVDFSSRTWFTQSTTRTFASNQNQKLNKTWFAKESADGAWITHSSMHPISFDADEKNTSQHAIHGNDPHVYEPARGDPPLKPTFIGDVEPLVWHHTLLPKLSLRAEDPSPMLLSPKSLQCASVTQVSNAACIQNRVHANDEDKTSSDENPDLRADPERANSYGNKRVRSQESSQYIDSHEYLPALDGPPLKCACIEDADSLSGRRALRPKSPPLPAPAPDVSCRSRPEWISWKSSLVPPPPPPRKTTDTDSSNDRRQCLRLKGLPVPPPPPAMTTRTRTQQRRDRAKTARIRKFESYNRALLAAKERRQLRFEKQTHAGGRLSTAWQDFAPRRVTQAYDAGAAHV